MKSLAAVLDATSLFSSETALRLLLLVPLGLLGLFFVVVFLRALLRLRKQQTSSSLQEKIWPPSALKILTGFVTNFFDTLGIGSFATTTTLFRALRLVEDDRIPGTLNVGHTLSAVLGAFIFIQLVPVQAMTLVPMIVAAMLGAWFGAGIVSKLPRQLIRLGMGMALLAAAALMLLTATGYLPAGGDALGLSWPQLIVAVIGNFIFGSLMTLGIGLYAPCMILIYLLGMHPLAAFPIMMGSCAYLMPVSSVRFVESGRYSPSAALGLALGGVPALFIAAFLVKNMDIQTVRWVVIVVVVYTGTMLLRAALAERSPQAAV